jgi:hypothetical protein
VQPQWHAQTIFFDVMEKVNPAWTSFRQWMPALLPLLLAMACYIAFRTSRTVANELIVLLAGNDYFTALSSLLAQWLSPIEEGSGWLPSFLWVLALALWARGWWLSFSGIRFPLVAAPAVMNAIWECVQALHLSDGHANWADVFAGFAASAVVFIWDKIRKREAKILQRLCWHHLWVAMIGCSMIYLADVRVP